MSPAQRAHAGRVHASRWRPRQVAPAAVGRSPARTMRRTSSPGGFKSSCGRMSACGGRRLLRRRRHCSFRGPLWLRSTGSGGPCYALAPRSVAAVCVGAVVGGGVRGWGVAVRHVAQRGARARARPSHAGAASVSRRRRARLTPAPRRCRLRPSRVTVMPCPRRTPRSAASWSCACRPRGRLVSACVCCSLRGPLRAPSTGTRRRRTSRTRPRAPTPAPSRGASARSLS